MRTHKLLVAAGMTAIVALSGCQKNDGDKGQAAAPPPTQVAVITAKTESLPITNELPGRIAPTRIAEVRPRATGIVIERVFEQGTMVKAGDVLYRIDPAPFEVQVASAQATLRRAEAVQMQARQLSDRQQALKKANVSSGQQLDDAVGQLAAADADVASAEAGLASAKLNLQYASVTAPISGRIGRALITEGALVSANGSENLATIQQLDPVYADFTQSATDLSHLRKALKSQNLMGAPEDAAVQLLMDDGSHYPEGGKLLFSEAAVDETTGQVTLRGEFPNPNGELLPGMYVRVQIQQGIEPNAITVPLQALQRDPGGKSQIYVVKQDNTLELRPVTTGRVFGDRWQISQGLQVGEKVVVEGFQKIRPGATIAPTDWTPPAPVKTDEQQKSEAVSQTDSTKAAATTSN